MHMVFRCQKNVRNKLWQRFPFPPNFHFWKTLPIVLTFLDLSISKYCKSPLQITDPLWGPVSARPYARDHSSARWCPLPAPIPRDEKEEGRGQRKAMGACSVRPEEVRRCTPRGQGRAGVKPSHWLDKSHMWEQATGASHCVRPLSRNTLPCLN